MPRTPTYPINYAAMLGAPTFVEDAGPPVAITTVITYGVGYLPPSGPLVPYNFRVGDSRPACQGVANGISVSYTYDPTTATYSAVQSQLISLIAAQEGLTVGTDTIIVP